MPIETRAAASYLENRSTRPDLHILLCKPGPMLYTHCFFFLNAKNACAHVLSDT